MEPKTKINASGHSNFKAIPGEYILESLWVSIWVCSAVAVGEHNMGACVVQWPWVSIIMGV